MRIASFLPLKWKRGGNKNSEGSYVRMETEDRVVQYVSRNNVCADDKTREKLLHTYPANG